MIAIIVKRSSERERKRERAGGREGEREGKQDGKDRNIYRVYTCTRDREKREREGG
jgi:hypothetical protein